jgi:hypothetical protein
MQNVNNTLINRPVDPSAFAAIGLKAVFRIKHTVDDVDGTDSSLDNLAYSYSLRRLIEKISAPFSGDAPNKRRILKGNGQLFQVAP